MLPSRGTSRGSAGSTIRASAVVFAGGQIALTARLRQHLASFEPAYIVAADSGAETALQLGFTPDLVIGDMDSIDARTLRQLEAAGVSLERHPRDKDATDGELALQRALDTGVERVVLVGFLGGPRLDQELASVLLLSRLRVDAVLLDGANECRLLRPGAPAAWLPEPGEIISLVPLDDVVGIRTRGLRWPLADESLPRGSTRGVSNEPGGAGGSVSVSIEHGLVLLCRYFPGNSRREGAASADRPMP